MTLKPAHQRYVAIITDFAQKIERKKAEGDSFFSFLQMLADMALSGVLGLVDNIHIVGTPLQYRYLLFKSYGWVTIYSLLIFCQQFRKQVADDGDTGALIDQLWGVDWAAEYGGTIRCGADRKTGA